MGFRTAEEQRRYRASLPKKPCACGCGAMVAKRYALGHHKRKPRATPESKICRCCKQLKSAKEFHKDSQKCDGLHSYCKVCKAVKDKPHGAEYYKNNKAAKLACSKGWWEKNYKTKMPQYTRRYYERHKEKLRSKSRSFYRERKEVILADRKQAAAQLRESYIRMALAQGTGLRQSVFPMELINLKRAQLKGIRATRKKG